MALSLHTIKPKKGSKKTAKRVGRGLGSKGTYSGRGAKGQRSRSGGKSGLKLKGLKKIMLSMPKQRGFKSDKKKSQVVNLNELNKFFKEGATITPKNLLSKKLVSDASSSVKILGSGNISIKITIQNCLVSASAKEKIEKAGGSIV